MNMTTTITTTDRAPIAAALNAQREIAAEKFAAFENDILVNRLVSGLHCLKAHTHFCISDAKTRGAMKGKKSSTTTVELFATGLDGWLSEHASWIKPSTARDWMNAVKGLGLDENASTEDVETALAQNRRIGPVTLKSLKAAAVELIGPPPTPPALPNHQQAEFDFQRETLTAYRIQSEGILAIKDQLIPEMHKAACARAYATLSELTGTQWTPSDEPDELANINPDSIEL